MVYLDEGILKIQFGSDPDFCCVGAGFVNQLETLNVTGL